MIQSNRQIWGIDFPVGGQWDAGVTLPICAAEKAGRWTVKREAGAFKVVFIHFASKEEELLNTFPDSEQGEIEAKTFALAACQTR